MAAGKRHEERHRAYELASLVWSLTDDKLTQFDLSEFFRTGSFADPALKRLPSSPVVDRFAAQMEAAGRFLMPHEMSAR